MVNQWTGEWTEEKDYSTYPKEKWCMYDYLAVLIRREMYEPKTSMENLITIILLAVDNAIEDGTDIVKEDPQDIIWWVKEQGGLSEFDYEV